MVEQKRNQADNSHDSNTFQNSGNALLAVCELQCGKNHDQQKNCKLCSCSQREHVLNCGKKQRKEHDLYREPFLELHRIGGN